MARKQRDNRVRCVRPNRETRQRREIFETLQRLTSHPTAAELYELVRQRLPRISLGTVYRNLDALSRVGAVRRLEIGHGEARFDGDCGWHYHVRCAECGRLTDVRGLTIEVQPEAVARLTGYRIVGHHLGFVGICPSCQDSTGSPEGDRAASGMEIPKRRSRGERKLRSGSRPS
jgi:Fur family transcriptional regulator, ferric uptake regulator